MAEACSQKPSVVQFRNCAGVEGHGFRYIQGDGQIGIGLGLEFAQEEPVGAPVYPPVDAPNIVAGHVGAVFGEIRGQAEVGGAVQTADEARDDGLGDQFEGTQAREYLRIDESGSGGVGGGVAG